MRDNHQGYPEIVAVNERDDSYFGVVRLTLPSDSAAFEFGVDRQGYGALKRILQTRPFDQMPACPYRYFFTGNCSRKAKNAEPVTIVVRVEQGTKSKNFDFDCPTSLASNLRWFFALKDLNEAAALKRIDV